MIRKAMCSLMLAIGTWLGSASPAEASCTGSGIQVVTQPIVVGEAIPVTWVIEPACAVIESGLLLGPDPTSLAPVGQPIYGHRASYQEEIPVTESGQYWIAAYALDETGGIVQSPPRFVLVVLPLPLPDTSHGSHGALSSYTGTDADFLQPAGDPHYASLRNATSARQIIISATDGLYAPVSVIGGRLVSSTHRDEVLADLETGVVVEGVTLTFNPSAINNALDGLDRSFQLSRFPRPGLYTVDCGAQVLGVGGRNLFQDFGCSGIAIGPMLNYTESLNDSSSVDPWGTLHRQTQVDSVRSDFAYFIPRPPLGRRVQSAKLRANVWVIGDFTALRLSGKSPATIVPVFCDRTGCSLRVTWDFTEEARSFAAQGGGELRLTLDPVPPKVFEFPGQYIRMAYYFFLLDANYPWQHGGQDRALTLTFEEACPQELTLQVDPSAVRPRLPANTRLTGALASIPTQATVEVLVKSCPPTGGSPASVEVTFEGRAPAAGSTEAGGHAHNTHRPTGTLQQDGQPVTSCLALLDAEGLGSCTVTFHPSEVSGVETIAASAAGFPEATAKVTVQVPGLVELPEDPARYVLVGAPQNHAGTDDPCRGAPPTSRHPQNHFGQPQLNAAVVAIAEQMLRETGILVRMNDMSLLLGGLFDIGNNWSPPHRSHRVGLEVDIGFTGVQKGACVPLDRNRLKKSIQEVTKRVPRVEGDHFHAVVR